MIEGFKFIGQNCVKCMWTGDMQFAHEWLLRQSEGFIKFRSLGKQNA